MLLRGAAQDPTMCAQPTAILGVCDIAVVVSVRMMDAAMSDDPIERAAFES